MGESPWVTRAKTNSLPKQAYAGTAAYERVTKEITVNNEQCDHAFGITVDGIDQCAECRRVFPIVEALPPSLRDEFSLIVSAYQFALWAVAIVIVICAAAVTLWAHVK